MKMSAVPHRGLLESAVATATHAASWPAACAVTVTVAGILAFRLLAERARRKTLETTYRYAPPRTVVIQDQGPGGPAMRIWVGDQPRLPAAWIVLSSLADDLPGEPW
jgi:hypothetical protein